MMNSQKVEKVCHFDRQREIFLLNQLVLLRFLPSESRITRLPASASVLLLPC